MCGEVPLTGMAFHAPTENDWHQHFELTSVVPAFLVGYILISTHSRNGNVRLDSAYGHIRS